MEKKKVGGGGGGEGRYTECCPIDNDNVISDVTFKGKDEDSHFHLPLISLHFQKT